MHQKKISSKIAANVACVNGRVVDSRCLRSNVDTSVEEFGTGRELGRFIRSHGHLNLFGFIV